MNETDYIKFKKELNHRMWEFTNSKERGDQSNMYGSLENILTLLERKVLSLESRILELENERTKK